MGHEARSQSAPVDVVLIGGDGIGPEVVEAAAACLTAAAEAVGRRLVLEHAMAGGAAIDRGDGPLPPATLEKALAARAVLLGAVGGPRWDRLSGTERPEAGLLKLRRALGAYANVRPVRLFEGLEDATPIRPELVRGTDLVIVRELLGGLYYGPRGRRAGPEGEGTVAFDTMEYSTGQIDAAARFAFDLARRRRKRLCLVDKANILESSRLWRERVEALAGAYPDVTVTYEYVDSCAMKLVSRPASFDVLLCENTFGDILSDEAAVLTGSLGMLPSASLGGRVGLYEPVHGTAPDIAGRGIANPLGAILSACMLLEWSLELPEAARALEDAVAGVLRDGLRTPDLARGAAGTRTVTTREMTERILERLREIA